MKKLSLIFLTVLLLGGCGSTGIPKKVKPINNFELEKYLGTWYELARLDHRFERNLINVTANYSMRKDGGVRVLNKGFSTKKGKWKEAEGKAYFIGNKDLGHLKVSFFGPFYGSYIIFEYQENDYAFVSGPDESYLWLLSRSPILSPELKQKFIAKSAELGFDTNDLIFVEHN